MSADARRSGSARHKSRQHALEILFEADLRDASLRSTLEERTEAAEPPVRELTATLVRGVADNLREVDARVAGALSPGWTLARMPRVDRVIARLATYELGWLDTDQAVVISEALELAKELSTDESPAFLNAVLGKVAEAGPAV